MYTRLHVTYRLFLTILMNLGLSRQIFSSNTQISNLMKIRPVGAELFYADGRTDMTKLIVAFRSAANALLKIGIKNVRTMYKVVQIWPGQTVTCLHTNRPGHIWTTLYNQQFLPNVFCQRSQFPATVSIFWHIALCASLPACNFHSFFLSVFMPMLV